MRWNRKRSIRAAAAFLQELEEAIDSIAAPARWADFDAGARRYVLRRLPFLLIYREEETAIQVLAVAHGRRRPGYWLERTDARV